MKRLFLLAYILIVGSALHAQNYQTIYSNRPSIWNNLVNNFSYYPFTSNYYSDTSYYGISVDSVKFLTADSVFYHYNIIASDTSIMQPCLPLAELPNWTGSKTIIKSIGENIFFNNKGDSIFINTLAKRNDKWNFYTFSDTSYIQASIISDTIKTFLGITDSVKIITLNFINANTSDTIANSWNGKHLILSKNYGLLQAYDFANFPNDTFAFSLSGIANPNLGVQNLTTKDIYNYEIGDEFDIETTNIEYTPITRGGTTEEKRIVIAKVISPAGDSVTYSYKRWTLNNSWNPVYDTLTHQNDTTNDHTTTFTYDTLTETLPLKDSALDAYPLKVVNHDSYSLGLDGLSKYDDLNGLYYYSDSCYMELIGDFPTDVPYMKGLGGGYYSGDIGPASQDYRALVYYKKGSDSSGTPYDFSAYFTGIATTNQQLNLTVSPNPFSENTTIKVSNPLNTSYFLKVIDNNGRTLKEYNFTGNEQKISSDNLTPGMYYFLISNANGQSSSGKLVVY